MPTATAPVTNDLSIPPYLLSNFYIVFPLFLFSFSQRSKLIKDTLQL